MVLRYWGERGVSAESFAALVDRSAAGIRTTALVSELQDRGWQVTAVDGTAALLAGELASGRPVIALIEDRPGVFHYIVIVAVTERAVIFHDPARAPLRVFTRDEFDRRSRAAGRWMAIVLPGARADPPAGAAPAPSFSPGTASCNDQVAEGVQRAQAGDLDAAARTLTSALSCPGPSAPRELAGVRLLQRRWEDAAQLSMQAVEIEPSDEYAWRVLGTSRFLLERPLEALAAWNHVGEPRLDLVRVAGLERTRQRPVERMLGIAPGEVISPSRFVRAQRALRGLPSARSTRLELAAVPGGLAELRAAIVERGRLPSDRWTWAAIAARAVVTGTASLTLGSWIGAGESVAWEWRFWPHRPRVAASLRVPAAWPGTWGADVFAEGQDLDRSPDRVSRRGGRFTMSRWAGSSARLDVRGGAERWNGAGTVGALGLTAGWLSGAERLSGRVVLDAWAGARRFGSGSVAVTASSAPGGVTTGTAPLGLVVDGAAGGVAVTAETPLDLWPGGDTGQARSILARAHPILDDGRLQVDRIGRIAVFASGEVQHWWSAPAFTRIAMLGFVDTVRTMRRAGGIGSIGDVDVGGGVGIASLLVPGRVYLNYAHGLRDGADAFSARYVVGVW